MQSVLGCPQLHLAKALSYETSDYEANYIKHYSPVYNDQYIHLNTERRRVGSIRTEIILF